VKTFRNAGDSKNATAGLWIKGNLRARGETRGTGQTRRQKRRLTRRLAVKTRTQSRRRVLTWFASRWRNHQPKRAEKPHSKSSDRKALDGPATRPQTPLAVENSVGKLAAPPSGAPNASMGKRAWRTPIPHLAPARPQGRAGAFCFGRPGSENTKFQTPSSRKTSKLQSRTY